MTSFVLSFISFLLLLSLSSLYIVDIEPGERECYIISLTSNTPYSGNFDLLSPSKVYYD